MKIFLIFLLQVFLFGVDTKKLLDCYDIFEEKKQELEFKAEKIQEQMEAFQALKKAQNTILDKKIKKAQYLLKENNQTLQKISKKEENIKKLLEQNKKILQEIKKAKMDKLVASFSKMRAGNAANVLADMDLNDSLKIVTKLSPKILAKILAKMDSKKAAIIVENMTKINTSNK